jgi:hypothetical protein
VLLLRGDDRSGGALLLRGNDWSAGALLLRGDEQRAAVNGIEEGAAVATSEEDLGFARNETRMERERPGRMGIRPTLTYGTHGALPLANFDSDSPATS